MGRGLAGSEASSFKKTPVGAGPFKFVSWTVGEKAVIERNDDYWGAKAYVAKLVVRIVKDETAVTELWQRGEFDLMTLTQPSVWRAPGCAWSRAPSRKRPC